MKILLINLLIFVARFDIFVLNESDGVFKSRRVGFIYYNKSVCFTFLRLLYHISGLMRTIGSSQSRTGLISQSRRGPPRAGQGLLEPTGWIPLSSALPMHALGRLGKFLPSI